MSENGDDEASDPFAAVNGGIPDVPLDGIPPYASREQPPPPLSNGSKSFTLSPAGKRIGRPPKYAEGFAEHQRQQRVAARQTQTAREKPFRMARPPLPQIAVPDGIPRNPDGSVVSGEPTMTIPYEAWVAGGGAHDPLSLQMNLEIQRRKQCMAEGLNDNRMPWPGNTGLVYDSAIDSNAANLDRVRVHIKRTSPVERAADLGTVKGTHVPDFEKFVEHLRERHWNGEAEIYKYFLSCGGTIKGQSEVELGEDRVQQLAFCKRNGLPPPSWWIEGQEMTRRLQMSQQPQEASGSPSMGQPPPAAPALAGTPGGGYGGFGGYQPPWPMGPQQAQSPQQPASDGGTIQLNAKLDKLIDLIASEKLEQRMQAQQASLVGPPQNVLPQPPMLQPAPAEKPRLIGPQDITPMSTFLPRECPIGQEYTPPGYLPLGKGITWVVNPAYMQMGQMGGFSPFQQQVAAPSVTAPAPPPSFQSTVPQGPPRSVAEQLREAMQAADKTKQEFATMAARQGFVPADMVRAEPAAAAVPDVPKEPFIERNGMFMELKPDGSYEMTVGAMIQSAPKLLEQLGKVVDMAKEAKEAQVSLAEREAKALLARAEAEERLARVKVQATPSPQYVNVQPSPRAQPVYQTSPEPIYRQEVKVKTPAVSEEYDENGSTDGQSEPPAGDSPDAGPPFHDEGPSEVATQPS